MIKCKHGKDNTNIEGSYILEKVEETGYRARCEDCGLYLSVADTHKMVGITEVHRDYFVVEDKVQ